MGSPGFSVTAPVTIIPTQLVEPAVEGAIHLLRARFNSEIDRLWLGYADPVAVAPNQRTSTINMPHISENRWFTNEIVDPLTVPAAWVLVERSEQLIDIAQNFELSEHTMYVVLLTEDVEINRMMKTVWRYGIAAWRILHDKAFNNAYYWVTGYEYSPLYTRNDQRGQRMFRKDITMRVRARMYEPSS
jgi:hypothetical protein